MTFRERFAALESEVMIRPRPVFNGARAGISLPESTRELNTLQQMTRKALRVRPLLARMLRGKPIATIQLNGQKRPTSQAMTMDKLEQKKLLKGTMEFEIVEDGRLKVCRSSITRTNEEFFKLFELDHKCDKYRDRPVKFIVLALLVASPAFVFLIDMIQTLDIVSFYFSLVFLVPALGFLLAYFVNKTDIVVYRYRTNSNTAFTLWNDTPNRTVLNQFINLLSKKIEGSRIDPDSSKEQKLEIYKDALEFLLVEDVLTEEEAEKAFNRTRDNLSRTRTAKIFSIS